jgi:CO/xanthine dehydrogenase Mo-binding subunit
VDFEPLPNILTIDDAMREDSVPIHPGVAPAGSPPYKSKNVCTFTRVHKGNVERAFRTADFVLEESYETQQVHQGYLEPRATTAEVDKATGKIRVWTSTQSPFLVRATLAEMLSVSVSQIQVFATYIGGGFGAKILASLEPFCVALSKKSGRPVRIVLTREEDIVASTPRPGMRFWVKSAVKNGKITARQGKAIVDTGAYASDGAVYANIAAFQLIGPYDIPNVEVEGISVYTNKQPCGAYRAPGTMETAFAVESHTDMLAGKAKIDPVEFRLLNAWEDGSLGPTGQVMTGVGLKEAITRVAEKSGWEEFKRANRNRGQDGGTARGIGIALGLIPTVGIHSSGAYIKLNEDGKVVLVTGAQEIGTGALTGLVMIAAEELGVGMSDVMLLSGDTDFAPRDGGAQGSRTTFGAGNAVLRAARDAKEQMIDVAAHQLKVSRDRIVLADGAARVQGESKMLTYADLAGAANSTTGGPILGRGSFVQDFPSYDKSQVEGYTFCPSLHDPTYVAHVAVAEVDKATGRVSVVRYVAAQDLGHAINPLGAEGQIQGGVVQGIGYALYEEIDHDEQGRTRNANFTDYKLPTIGDVPPIETIIVEGHYGSGPYGAKGVGEANIVPPAPAIANAVFDAIGVRFHELPITRDQILAALKEKRK